MIHINHSAVVLFGREIELYGLVAVLGAAVLTVISALLAKRRGLNASLAFRTALLTLFGGVAVHVFFQAEIPTAMLRLSYVLSLFAVPLVFRLSARLFGADKNAFTALGITTTLGYTVVTNLCCTLGGCCYGPK